ncbi:High-affinity Na(+)/H(+) antiporter NhaS3 [compost metagenome]
MLFVAALTLAAVVTKLAGGALGGRLTGLPSRSAWAVGSGMISRGEVALIIAAAGLQARLLPAETFTPVIIAIILTTLIAPPLLKVFFSGSTERRGSL